jgi:hypothetical protein
LTLVPIGQGILASVIAVVIFCSWLAIGSFIVKPDPDDDEVLPLGAILIGSGVTSFCLALFAAAGLVRSGTVAVSAACLIATVFRWRMVRTFAQGIASPYRRAFESVPVALSGALVGAVLWLSAIAPPRSADAMRYHLAHIRQIIGEGRWTSIADYHYALPFGWSLTYLPFEILGLPQGSQILGVLVFVVFVSAIVRFLRRMETGQVAILATSLLLLHPATLRAFSEANADAYAMLVILTIALLIVRLPHVGARESGILGFASLIGLQSRYQLVAAAIASTLMFLILTRKHPVRVGATMAFAGGAIGAMILASPFYIANGMHFGNPVWPLFIDPHATNATYMDNVAYLYSGSLTGARRLAPFADAIVTLFTTRFLFPLAIVIVGAIIASVIRRRNESHPLGWLGVIFFVEWAAMAPLLYPRFVLLMLPVATVCVGLLLRTFLASRKGIASVVRYISITGIIFLAVFNAYVNRDNLRYAVNGNVREYHRYTWFYDTYDWINHNTATTSRLLVIVSSAHTYYLDRQYRRADPWVSGEVDWRRTVRPESLDSLLASGGYRYVLYEDRDWSDYYGGSEMQRTVGDAYRSGLLRDVKTFQDTLFTSRFTRSYRTTKVHLLERAASN